MSQDNFTGQNISSTFQRLLQLSDNGSYVTDGTGSIISTLPITASYVVGGGGGPESDPIFVAKSASLATTGSNQFIGNQQITGSVDITGSFGLMSYGTTAPTGTPTKVGLFYFTDTDLYISLE